MSQKRTYKRRHFFVKKEYQFKFILKFCLIILVGSIISTGLVLLFSRGTLTSSFEHSKLVVTNTATAILPAVILTNIITILIISLATIVVVLFISHKIAGPLFRFEKELKEIGEGDLTKVIRLRKKDQITDMAESLNSMTSNLRDRVLAIQTGVTQVLESASKQNAPEGLIEELDNLHINIHKNFKI
ncbi:MAG: methyl-accepting chemotaxis protein [Deltaproteobacteria bacterium]|nr:methyl-accepting chemotaxis protein [Deltaproteobacteria bacterium]MBW1910128.1 methyl-accepting chemotaxis protein [Deltaproteobacteria bacterium]MBW2032976.1 methyl-accepting chemotaxis protein [Deltaproteobacteria bacterium]MBW2115667.1 methyl-accepting chemotaxis protein [Deltaproteobacteria bacterium]MBW2169292.1 methyl-accepting chemotaxis protein [Deltaproteobacteria bacterium]